MREVWLPRVVRPYPMDDMAGYLTNLASADPTPGGGSAAMVSGALSCALTAMVARISKDEALAAKADALRERMAVLRAADEAAFAAVVAARGDREAMQRALLGAAEAPLDGAAACLEALNLATQAHALGNKHLVSDVGCAAQFAYAAFTSCIYNVQVNHKYIKDRTADPVQRQIRTIARDRAAATEAFTKLRGAVEDALTVA